MALNKFNLYTTLVAAVMLCASPVQAESAAPELEKTGLAVKPNIPEGRKTVRSLGWLHEQRLLIKAEVELGNAQAQLSKQGVTATRIEESYAPTVKMVQGVGNNLYATFLYPGDMAMDARVGDVITGGYKVESISVHQVVLSKDGQSLRLGFSASPPTPLPPDSQPAAFNASPPRMMGASGF